MNTDIDPDIYLSCNHAMLMTTAAAELQKVLTKLLADWNQLKIKDVAAINEQLRAANQPALNP